MTILINSQVIDNFCIKYSVRCNCINHEKCLVNRGLQRSEFEPNYLLVDNWNYINHFYSIFLSWVARMKLFYLATNYVMYVVYRNQTKDNVIYMMYAGLLQLYPVLSLLQCQEKRENQYEIGFY